MGQIPHLRRREVLTVCEQAGTGKHERRYGASGERPIWAASYTSDWLDYSRREKEYEHPISLKYVKLQANPFTSRECVPSYL
jgi:hypothetical protein